MWPDRRILDLLRIDAPILLAPMAGPGFAELAIAVAEAGGLGSLPTALLGPDQIRAELARFRAAVRRPINLNFFCHTPPAADPAREAAWRARLAPYYRELGLDPDAPAPAGTRSPFDETLCRLVEDQRPEVVSFHFGLPEPALVDRVRATGAVVLSSATTADEARWLAARGCHAIIAQGAEAGGHRGVFLEADPVAACAGQPGTMALVPQIADAVDLPVIAAGGIMDGRGVAAALALGASAVQMGSAFLLADEAINGAVWQQAIRDAGPDATRLTRAFSGRYARGLENRFVREMRSVQEEVPAYPVQNRLTQAMRASANAAGNPDLMSLWAGQAVKLAQPGAAGELVRRWWAEAQAAAEALSARTASKP